MKEKGNVHNEYIVLNSVHKRALAGLDAYLQTPREAMLREHQIDVMQSLRGFLGRGENAGYISLPTGSGKTVLATELIQALDLPTIVVSPSKQILEQTQKTAEKFIPDTKVTNYYADEKDLSGNVINTTYQSLDKISQINAVREGTGLLILDEVHTALGEQRHTLWRKFPNAIMIGLTAAPYFTPLEGYQQRGLVDEKERWTGVFKNKIHEMSLEEAMQRGVLAPLDVHLVKTRTRVDQIHITSGGKYDEKEINRQLNTKARNILVTGMLAGVEHIPSNVGLSQEQTDELQSIHQKIQGKRTAIFGLGVSQIEKLAERLQDLGLEAKTVHNRTHPNERKKILEAHTRGDVPIVLGVDMLRLGWDSPETEVGIYMAPTQSGIVAVEELGRILRPSEESGKERAVAIQLVDQYEKFGEKPILIPNIFDPEFVLRSANTGLGFNKTANNEKRERPEISFIGMDIDTLIEETRSEELVRGEKKSVNEAEEERFNRRVLRRKLEHAPIEEMDHIIQEVTVAEHMKNPYGSVVDLYRTIADIMPERITEDVQKRALSAAKSEDKDLAQKGKRTFLFLNLKTVLSAVDPYLSDDAGENDDIVQAGIMYVHASIDTISLNPDVKSTATLMHNKIKRSVAEHIAEKEHMSPNWVATKKHKEVEQKVNTLVARYPYGLNNEQIEDFAETLSKDMEISKDRLHEYITYRFARASQEEPVYDDAYGVVKKKLLRAQVDQVLQALPEREAGVIKRRYGLWDGEERTLDEVASTYGLSRERIRQIESKTMKKLRHPTRSRELRDYLEE